MGHIYTVQAPDIRDLDISYYTAFGADERAPRVFPTHIHDATEVFILLSGESAFVIERDFYPLRAGDAVIIRPGEIHHCVKEQPGPHEHLCFWLNSLPAFLLTPLLSGTPGSGGNRLSLSEENLPRVREIGGRLNEAHDAGDTAEEVTLLFDLLSVLRREKANATPGERLSALPARLKAILDEIDRDYAKIDDLDALAERHFVSRSTVNRLFRVHLRTSPRQYLEDRRLAGSRLLLKQGMRVSDVCAAVGFTDYSHYIRLFHHRFGMTPKQYCRSSPVEFSRSPYADKVK